MLVVGFGLGCFRLGFGGYSDGVVLCIGCFWAWVFTGWVRVVVCWIVERCGGFVNSVVVMYLLFFGLVYLLLFAWLVLFTGLVALISCWFALGLLISGRCLVGVVVDAFWDFAFGLVCRIAGAFRIWLVSLSCLRVVWVNGLFGCLLCCF